MLLSGNRDNAANSGSQCSNWNNYPWNSNWNISTQAVVTITIISEFC